MGRVGKSSTAIALFAITAAARSQPVQRDIQVPVTSGWQHAESRLIIPARPLGMTKQWLRDGTANEMDVSAEYKDVSAGLTATVYIYKTQLPDASLWFDRSLETIRLLPMWKLGDAPRPIAAAFPLPGSTIAGGLIAGFDVDASGLRGTALAVAPVGNWMVKVRLSSSRLDGAASTERLRALVAALRWPTAVSPAMPATRIGPCPDRLELKRAKVIRPDMTQSLLAAFWGR